jgi:hypothetical protein
MKCNPIKPFKPVLFILFGLGITLFACQDREYKTTMTYHDETYCEPWGLDSFASDTALTAKEKVKTKVKNFLWGKDIRSTNINIARTPDSIASRDSLNPDCPNCDCFTGRRLEAEVFSGDTSRIKRFNFQVDY